MGSIPKGQKMANRTDASIKYIYMIQENFLVEEKLESVD